MGFCRFFVGRFFSVFAYQTSLKRTANAPEDFDLWLLGDSYWKPAFFGGDVFVSRIVHFQVVIDIYRYIHRMFNYIYSIMYTIYEYECTK